MCFLKKYTFLESSNMHPETLCKTVHQYNKYPIAKEDMKKLIDIAKDYHFVKNAVYQRYGNIKGLEKIYPGFTVQKEMADTKLREQLQLPSVYFNVAILDAVGDIKIQWTRTQKRILKQINTKEDFSEDEKHYLRFLLKVNNAFEMVLNQKEIILSDGLQEKYLELEERVDVHKLQNYLRRQVRKYHKKPYAKNIDGFSITERAYRYDRHGIYITTKVSRKRVFVELTDHNSYKRQLYIKLYPEENNIEVLVPVDVKCQKHEDFKAEIGLSVGMRIMLTTHEGHIYGEQLGQYQIELAQWIRQQNVSYALNKKNNAGRKKYTKEKNRKTEQLHSYINYELNRFIQEEKPKTIYIPKLPPTQKHNGNKAINQTVSLWQRGYIRKRLQQKCKEHSIEVIEVFGKDISNVCSICGQLGKSKDELFYCEACGSQMDKKTNAAKNAIARGKS